MQAAEPDQPRPLLLGADRDAAPGVGQIAGGVLVVSQAGAGDGGHGGGHALAGGDELGYRDQWTRQHRFPTAEFVADDQGVTATVSAIAGAGLVDYQRAATYLADTWGCVTVRAEQQGPGLIRLRGLHRDPLLAPAQVDLSGIARSP